MIVFPFMIQEQLITFSFCKIHGWSILIQSFAKFIMGDTYVDAKTVLDSVKSSTWKFFKFRMSGGEVDKKQLRRWRTSPRGGCWTLMSQTRRAARRILWKLSSKGFENKLKYFFLPLLHFHLAGSEMSLPWTRTRTPLGGGRPREQTTPPWQR